MKFTPTTGLFVALHKKSYPAGTVVSALANATRVQFLASVREMVCCHKIRQVDFLQTLLFFPTLRPQKNIDLCRRQL